MSEPTIAQKAPYVLEMKAGDKVAWCACGDSKGQPYCDGSHQGTDFKPTIVTIEKDGNVAWCGCKKSTTKPYCDGTHSKL